MIWESGYWKADLLRQSEDLRRRMQQTRWSERSSVRVEQTIMLGFYAIRKLLEAKKLTDAVANRQVQMTVSPCRLGMSVHYFNWDRMDELYDFDAASKEVRDLGFLCNQIVHSYVFSLAFSAEGLLDGVLLASDRERRRRVFAVAMSDIVEIFEAVGRDEVTESQAMWDERVGEYRFTQS